MCSPISIRDAEIFLQLYEQIIIKDILEIKAIYFYTRHVDDVLSICDKSTTDESTLSNLTFTTNDEWLKKIRKSVMVY
jgi:hypothetical protein